MYDLVTAVVLLLFENTLVPDIPRPRILIFLIAFGFTIIFMLDLTNSKMSCPRNNLDIYHKWHSCEYYNKPFG